MKNKGNLLLEFLLNIFIFSIILVLLSIFLKRVLIIQNYKSKTLSANENSYYILDVIKENIKNRNMEDFSYKNMKNNIFILNNNNLEKSLLYRTDNTYTQIKFKYPKLLISNSDELNNFKKWSTLAQLDNINFYLKENILIITYDIENKKIEQVVNIK